MTLFGWWASTSTRQPRKARSRETPSINKHKRAECNNFDRHCWWNYNIIDLLLAKRDRDHSPLWYVGEITEEPSHNCWLFTFETRQLNVWWTNHDVQRANRGGMGGRRAQFVRNWLFDSGGILRRACCLILNKDEWPHFWHPTKLISGIVCLTCLPLNVSSRGKAVVKVEKVAAFGGVLQCFGNVNRINCYQWFCLNKYQIFYDFYGNFCRISNLWIIQFWVWKFNDILMSPWNIGLSNNVQSHNLRFSLLHKYMVETIPLYHY